MYQIWAYNTQEEEWIKVSGDIATWPEALNFALNRSLKDMRWNVAIHEYDDEDGECIERLIVDELNIIRCPDCRAEFNYTEEKCHGMCIECGFLIYEGETI